MWFSTFTTSLHLWNPWMQIFVFLQPMWCQERSTLSASRTFQPHSLVKTEKNLRKNMKFWPLNPYEKRSEWKTQLSERFSEALTSKLWNKKNVCWRSLQKWAEIELCSTPYDFIKNLPHIFLKDSHRKFMGQNEVHNTSVQNCMTWLVKKGKTVFSKVTLKISLSVSGKQSAEL